MTSSVMGCHPFSGIRKLYYIRAADELFAIYEVKNGTGKMYYIHKDHLGSYQAITGKKA